MTLDIFLALASFAFVTSFTPGPNNIMLTASGANFGFARSIPHMAGVVVGFVVLLVVSGGGLGAVLVAFPSIQTVLKVLGAAYMLWLAWKIANAHRDRQGSNADAQPLTFLQAAAFQWVNPKGVVMALGAVTLYVRPERAVTDLLILTAVFGMITFLSTVTWSCFGAALNRMIRDESKAQFFNIAMALLLVASIVPMVL